MRSTSSCACVTAAAAPGSGIPTGSPLAPAHVEAGPTPRLLGHGRRDGARLLRLGQATRVGRTAVAALGLTLPRGGVLLRLIDEALQRAHGAAQRATTELVEVAHR